MLNVRLGDEEGKALERYCRETGLSTSSVVKEALAEYMRRKKTSGTSYEFGADLFGGEGSSSSGHSFTYEKILRKKFMRSILGDAGPLIALFDKDDKYHQRAADFVRNTPGLLVTTWPVITEASHAARFQREDSEQFPDVDLPRRVANFRSGLSTRSSPDRIVGEVQ